MQTINIFSISSSKNKNAVNAVNVELRTAHRIDCLIFFMTFTNSFFLSIHF